MMIVQAALTRSWGFGALAFVLLLAAYFGAVSLVSGWRFRMKPASGSRLHRCSNGSLFRSSRIRFEG